MTFNLGQSGNPTGRKPDNAKRRTTNIVVRLTDLEKRDLLAVAVHANMTVSELVRSLIGRHP